MPGAGGDDEMFGLDQEDENADGDEQMGVGYPGAHVLREESVVDEGRVLWSRWDVLPAPVKGDGKARYVHLPPAHFNSPS